MIPATSEAPAARVGVVVVAAGSGSRFGGETPKQFLSLGGTPVVVRAARALLSHSGVAHAVIVLPEADASGWWRRIAPFLGDEGARVSWRAGGATRQDSVRAGLDALDASASAVELVAVHDGARPGVSKALFARVLAAAAASGAAIPAVAPADTLWRRDQAGFAAARIDRDEIRGAQTPQCFRRELLRAALARADEAGFVGTDEASLVHRSGCPVRLVEGSLRNHKVTRPADLEFLRGLLDAPPRAPRAPRTGIGYDAHRFGAAGPLRLGGLRFPEVPGLAGHSDGDALLHALTDAILGAVAAPDIGSLFPSSDTSLRGASSVRFLERALAIARAAGYAPGQADCVVIGERPRLAPRVPALRKRLAGLLGVPESAVGIKGTTTDGMGFPGRGEGLGVQAVVRLDPLPGPEAHAP